MGVKPGILASVVAGFLRTMLSSQPFHTGMLNAGVQQETVCWKRMKRDEVR